MKFIGKRIVAKNGDSALLVNGKIVLTNEKLNHWLYYVDNIKEVDGTYVAEGLTPVQTGVMNTTSLTFGDYKIYRRPFYVRKGSFVTNVENINESFKNKYFGGGDHPVAFVGVELEGYFPKLRKENSIEKIAKKVGRKYNVLSISTSFDQSIKSGYYLSREIQYMIDRSKLDTLKNLYDELGIKQNYSCGNHIHLSFNSPEYYWLVFSPIFYERFKREYEDHFKNKKYISRLSNKYCKYNGMNDIFDETRYKMINIGSFVKYGTAEFRILPYAESGEEYYEAVKFVVETTEKILNDLVKKEYLQKILSDYAIPLVIIDFDASGGTAFDLLKYFYGSHDFSYFFTEDSFNNNLALLYYPEKNGIIFFEYPVFSNLIVTKLTSENKPTQPYYYDIHGILKNLRKFSNM